MSKTPASKTERRRGVGGFLFVAFAAMAAAGVALELSARAISFWPVAQPGGRAMLGVAAAAIVIVSAWIGRFLFARASDDSARGGDAGNHS